MKTATPGMLALLQKDNNVIVDFFTFTLNGGEPFVGGASGGLGPILYLCSGDVSISYGGNLYLATGPITKRTKFSQKIGMDVGSMDIEVYAKATDLVGATPWLQALLTGMFDGAEVNVDRVPMPTYGDTSNGVINLFQGRVAQVIFGRSLITITCNDHRELLNIDDPYRLFQPACVHTLYDNGCGLNKATFSDTATVQPNATASSVPFASSRPVGWYDVGVLNFVTGQNIGVARTIKSWDGVTAKLGTPLPYVPAAGDTISVAAGCLKDQTTCLNKFNNLPQFAGTPFVPQAETAL